MVSTESRRQGWPNRWVPPRSVVRVTRIVPAALVVALLALAGCAQTSPTVPATTVASRAEPTASPTTATPTQSSVTIGPATPPSSTPATATSASPTSAAPRPSGTPSATGSPSPQGSSSDPETAPAVALPDGFGGWTKLESRQEGAWTIAVYSQLATGQLAEVHASTSPGATFEEVVADLIGPNAEQVETGAVCTSRAGIAGCAQQQDALTVAITSPNMGEAQVAEALAQLLAALR